MALMGCSMSEEQEELLVRHFKAAWLMLDGDGPGQHGAADCLARLARRIWVRVSQLPNAEQPDQLTLDEIRRLLA